jgi:hypothetical protein|tara:strand:+ start:1056 stop:1991 length:936 start_codon:yes stop_codon:yes gene_type:complete
MAKNPYFYDNSSEQRLVEDLTRETISAMGRDVYYIPRKQFNKDYLYGEDPITKFKGSYKIEMYVKSVNGFEGQGDIISKFGIELKDRVELIVSRKVFEDIISRSDSDLSRPREGDLIYFPLSDTIFEINFVEHENPFYPLGKRYTFVLSCEAFTYSHEDFDTDQNFIDDVATEQHTKGFELYMGISGGATDFILGEQVFHIIGNTAGSIDPVISNASGIGTVFEWNPREDGLLIIGNMTGTFNIEVGEYIYGVSSGITTGSIASWGSLNLKIPTIPGTTLDLLDSLNLEKEKTNENLFDFTDIDPFSEGNY